MWISAAHTRRLAKLPESTGSGREPLSWRSDSPNQKRASVTAWVSALELRSSFEKRQVLVLIHFETIIFKSAKHSCKSLMLRSKDLQYTHSSDSNCSKCETTVSGVGKFSPGYRGRISPPQVVLARHPFFQGVNANEGPGEGSSTWGSG